MPNIHDEVRECKSCGRKKVFLSAYCGAWVCDDCDNHNGLTRCYCGWSESGGDGYAELLADGETIEPEEY